MTRKDKHDKPKMSNQTNNSKPSHNGQNNGESGFFASLLGSLPRWNQVVEGSGATFAAVANSNSHAILDNLNGVLGHDDFFFVNAFGAIGLHENITQNNEILGAVGSILTPSSSPQTNSSSCISPPVPMCCRCDVAASVRCLDCNDALCEDCAHHNHRNEFAREHCIVPLSNMSPIGTQPVVMNVSPKLPADGQCDTHNEALRYVCESCRKVVCQECTLWDHKDHMCKPLETFVINIADRFRNSVHSGKTGTQYIKASIDKAVQYSQSIERDAMETSGKIRKAMRHFILAAEDRERTLLEKVERFRQQKLTSLSDQMAGLRAALAGISQTADFLNKAIDNIPHMTSLEVAQAITKGESQLEQFAMMCKNLIPREEFITFVGPSFELSQEVRTQGDVILCHKKAASQASQHQNPGPSNASGRRPIRGNTPSAIQVPRPVGSWEPQQQNGNSVSPVPPSIPCTQNIGQCIPGSGLHIIARPSLGPSICFAYDGHEEGQVSRPWGLCVDKDGHIIIADRRNNRVQVFYPDGTFKLHFGTKGTANGQFDLPAGICVDPQNRIIVVDKDNHRVQIFSHNGNFLHKFGCYGKDCGQFQYPWDVTASGKGEILITDSRNHRIQLFSPDGHFISRFSFDGINHSRNLKGLTTPRGVCFTPQGDIIVSDFENHRLLLIDSCLSKILAAKGHEGNGCQEFSRPSGLICDDDGRVIVADSKNQRVMVFTPTLEYLWSVEIRPLMPSHGMEEKDRPSDVALLPTGQLVVMVETSPDARDTTNPNKTFVQVF